MNTKDALQRLEDTVNQYLQELGHFSMDQLKRQPSEEEWSLG